MSVNRTSAPLGIKVLCVLGGIGALLGILGGFGIMAYGGIGVLLGPVVIVLSIAQLFIIYGLWTLQSWAWTAALALYGLDIVLDVVNLVLGNPSAIIGMVIAALIMLYIYSKRDHYKSNDRSVPQANSI